MLRFVRSWSAVSRSLPQFAPARCPHARRRPMLECLESRSLLSTITLTVNSLVDAPSSPGVTTLRGAITQADADTSDNYVIRFAVKGVIDLTTPLPDLANNITIHGPGAASLTIQRDSSAVPFSVLTVNSGENVKISGVTISGGDTVVPTSFITTPSNLGSGGGINNSGTLLVSNSAIVNNSAEFAGDGINNNGGGTLTILDSTIAGNSSEYSAGGGICNAGTLTVISSNFVGNTSWTGGGIFNGESGVVDVSSSAFVDNSATGNSATSAGGGGIFNYWGVMNVNASVFVGNTAAGGSGGGVYSYSAGATPNLIIANSAFIGNTAGDGGGIANQ